MKVQKIVYSLIRRKTFEKARVFKKWQVIVDATELDEGYLKKNNYFLDAGEWCVDITEYRIGKKHVEEMVAISNKNQY